MKRSNWKLGVLPNGALGAIAHAKLNILYKTNPVFNEYKPLAVGIVEALIAEGHQEIVARAILHIHTFRTKYLENIVNGMPRHYLDGSIASETTEKDKEYSRLLLKVKPAIDSRNEKEKQERYAAKLNSTDNTLGTSTVNIGI